MKPFKITLTLIFILFLTSSVLRAQNRITTPRIPSPAAKVEQTVGASTISLEYSRPNVIATNGDDRTDKIWGIMVPYDFELQSSFGNKKPLPWRAGANENTLFKISHDAKIEGKPLKAGTYGLFVTIKENGGAMVIFSKDTTSWGSFFYEESNDALRVNVKTEAIPLKKRLVYNFIDVTKNSTVVVLDWEKKRIPFKIEFDTDAIVLTDIKNKLSKMKNPSWGSYNTAANYCLNNNTSLKEGLEWAEASISIKKTFANQTTKSNLLAKLGQQKEADDFMKGVLKSSETTADNYYSYSQYLNRSKKYKEALDILDQLKKRWPDSWLTYHGLARTYSAMHDLDRALKNEKKALEKAPDANKPFIRRAIKMLEAGLNFNSLG